DAAKIRDYLRSVDPSSGDDVVRPLLREQMPKGLADRVMETASLDIHAPQHEVLAATLAALREQDAATDRERVDELTEVQAVSRKNNVNPDYYKSGGPDRPDEKIPAQPSLDQHDERERARWRERETERIAEEREIERMENEEHG
ncbi:MAG TPA: hypothetical protein VKD69_20970, partial [Vicinamibacterales bacterium]|nr:hypothetical protein [Vicinamibacterales bacterium]